MLTSMKKMKKVSKSYGVPFKISNNRVKEMHLKQFIHACGERPTHIRRNTLTRQPVEIFREVSTTDVDIRRHADQHEVFPHFDAHAEISVHRRIFNSSRRSGARVNDHIERHQQLAELRVVVSRTLPVLDDLL